MVLVLFHFSAGTDHGGYGAADTESARGWTETGCADDLSEYVYVYG